MRNSSLLIFWRRLLTIALLSAAVSCLGDDEAPTSGAQGADAKGSSETRQRPGSGGRPATPRPPRPFQPSEKISADSAVSFPVDI